MIVLYYTGAETQGDPQTNKNLSLGGFISSTRVPNGLESALFSFPLDQDQIRVLAVQSTTIKSGVSVWLEYPESVSSEFEISYGDVYVDDCGKLFSEKIDSEFALPYAPTVPFQAATQANPLALPDFLQNQYVTLFVRRKKVISQLTKEERIDALYESWKTGLQENKIQTTQLVFSYT